MIKKLINSKLGQQIIKFGAVGFLCFFIEYVLLILFKELLGWPVIAANTLAFTVSAIVNYILSILFVFDTDKKANQGKQFAVFFILAVGGLILNNDGIAKTDDLESLYYAFQSDLKQCRLKARHDGSRPVLEPFLHHC